MPQANLSRLDNWASVRGWSAYRRAVLLFSMVFGNEGSPLEAVMRGSLNGLNGAAGYSMKADA